MRLSLAYEMQRPVVDDHAVIEETIEQCVLADKMGFDAVWFVEHHFLTSFSMSPCPEVIFGALTQRTKRIRLGFGVVILPYHHPVRVAERVAMVDHLSGGRVEFGTGRSAAYEQIGMGIDPRHTRAMWEESLAMIPKIWEDGLFSWEGQFWNVPPRDVRPKPYQKPHPRMWVAALQPATYQLAAEKGIGVMALSVAAPSYLEPHIKAYKERVRHATPVGKVINDQWLSSTMGLCDADDKAARELAAKSLRTFFGPDRPYLKDQTHLYEQLVDSWGGVPEHLKANFARYLKTEGHRRRARGGSVRRLRADRDRAVEPDRRRHPRRPRRPRGRQSRDLPSDHRHSRGRGRRRAAVPHGDRDGAPRQGDVVHRDVRPPRHPRAQEEEAPRAGGTPDRARVIERVGAPVTRGGAP